MTLPKVFSAAIQWAVHPPTLRNIEELATSLSAERASSALVIITVVLTAAMRQAMETGVLLFFSREEKWVFWARQASLNIESRLTRPTYMKARSSVSTAIKTGDARIPCHNSRIGLVDPYV